MRKVDRDGRTGAERKAHWKQKKKAKEVTQTQWKQTQSRGLPNKETKQQNHSKRLELLEAQAALAVQLAENARQAVELEQLRQKHW